MMNELYKLGLTNLSIRPMTARTCLIEAKLCISYDSYCESKEFTYITMNIEADTPDDCINILTARIKNMQLPEQGK